MEPSTTTLDTRVSSPKTGEPTGELLRWLKSLLALLLIGLLVALGVWVEREEPFTAGSDLGYWMGVTGGSMMLFLLIYPLRKHWRRMHRAGEVRHWFRLHMVFGIVGPVIVLFHSTFRIGSLNGRIAFYSMVIVAASGVIGRFIYARIHRGLYGRQLTLRDLEGALATTVVSMNRLWLRAPSVRDRLEAFRDFALREAGLETGTRKVRLRHFLMLGLHGYGLRIGVRAELRRVLQDAAKREGWSARRLARERRTAAAQVALFVRAVQAVARLSAWERLFAWWHVAHAPLVYLLVLSAIAHVVAVHMY